MKKTEKQMWVCDQCGSIHVETKVWVNLNDSSINWDSSTDLDEFYCQDCENTGVELKTIKTVNGTVKIKGYQVKGIDAELHPAMSDANSLYSLEQANEMLLDRNVHGEWYLKAYYKGDVEEPTLMFKGKNPRKLVEVLN